jgi:hypothetical protein
VLRYCARFGDRRCGPSEKLHSTVVRRGGALPARQRVLQLLIGSMHINDLPSRRRLAPQQESVYNLASDLNTLDGPRLRTHDVPVAEKGPMMKPRRMHEDSHQV